MMDKTIITTHKVFEYRNVLGRNSITDETLESLGREGWELCAILASDRLYTKYFFKREIVEVKL